MLILILLVGGGAYFHTQFVPPVLMYHAVDAYSHTSKLSVSPQSFARQMAFLRRHHYRIVSLDTLADWLERATPVPHNVVVVTIDDGFASIYENAFPVLKAQRIPAAFFVNTSLVGTPGYVTWDQLREMRDAGITIGSHCVTHRWLPGSDEATLRYELFVSKDELEQQLGVPAEHFAYPFGAYNAHVQALVREAGYRTACATNPGRREPATDRYAIKRLRISENAGNLFVFWVESSGYYTWIKEHRDD